MYYPASTVHMHDRGPESRHEIMVNYITVKKKCMAVEDGFCYVVFSPVYQQFHCRLGVMTFTSQYT